ncbi:unnamed protein product [marine sediment metagenome]|uniref:Uncharacterized protein n=1 Tax=marine sediment metagenome TaxID=412755 RepID=X0XJ20_9ZZZZ
MIRIYIKKGFVVLLKYMQSEDNRIDPQLRKAYKEIVEAIEVLCGLISKYLNLKVEPRLLNPTYKSRRQKKCEKREKVEQKKEQKKQEKQIKKEKK